jgi:hypothetical protein
VEPVDVREESVCPADAVGVADPHAVARGDEAPADAPGKPVGTRGRALNVLATALVELM